ncbi:type II toxin-antitoxin system HicA family toxin (plasmid) [Clostridium perfringens]
MSKLKKTKKKIKKKPPKKTINIDELFNEMATPIEKKFNASFIDILNKMEDDLLVEVTNDLLECAQIYENNADCIYIKFKNTIYNEMNKDLPPLLESCRTLKECNESLIDYINFKQSDITSKILNESLEILNCRNITNEIKKKTLFLKSECEKIANATLNIIKSEVLFEMFILNSNNILNSFTKNSNNILKYYEELVNDYAIRYQNNTHYIIKNCVSKILDNISFDNLENNLNFLKEARELCENDPLLDEYENYLNNNDSIETFEKIFENNSFKNRTWKELNNIAEKKGFKYVRSNGDHGIFKHKNGNIVVIPQGREIGKGLQIKIINDIEYLS